MEDLTSCLVCMQQMIIAIVQNNCNVEKIKAKDTDQMPASSFQNSGKSHRTFWSNHNNMDRLVENTYCSGIVRTENQCSHAFHRLLLINWERKQRLIKSQWNPRLVQIVAYSSYYFSRKLLSSLSSNMENFWQLNM